MLTRYGQTSARLDNLIDATANTQWFSSMGRRYCQSHVCSHLYARLCACVCARDVERTRECSRTLTPLTGSYLDEIYENERKGTGKTMKVGENGETKERTAVSKGKRTAPKASKGKGSVGAAVPKR